MVGGGWTDLRARVKPLTNGKESAFRQKSTLLYSYQAESQAGFKTPQILKYKPHRVISLWALRHLSGTVFMSAHLILHLVLYLAVAYGVHYVTSQFTHIDAEHAEKVSDVASYLSTITAFMVGLHIAVIVSRWWSIRCNCIGGLWGAVDDLCMILATHMPDPSDRPYKERVLRLCLLSHSLCYHQARGQESETHLRDNVNRGLMTEEELQIMKDMTSKPQVVWVWICRLMHHLADLGKLRNQHIMEPQIDALCVKARAAIGELFTYIDTQIPFAWVHMLTVIVMVSNLLVSTKSGLIIGSMMRPDGEWSWTLAAVQACHVILVPFVYHAFLLLSAQLTNPLGDDFNDFPSYAYHCFMREENLSFFDAGERTPSSILEDPCIVKKVASDGVQDTKQ